MKPARYLGAAEARFDSIILDINLPDGDGRDFCAKIRRQGHTMPIIMLTGASDEDDVVSGLNAGANDYIAKPFRVNELLARLQAQLRLFDTSEDAVFTIGPYTFRPAAKLLIGADKKQRIRLTAKEVDILKFLYRHANRVVSRQILLDEVWGYNAGVTTHTLETHVYRLRQKIESRPHQLPPADDCPRRLPARPDAHLTTLASTTEGDRRQRRPPSRPAPSPLRDPDPLAAVPIKPAASKPRLRLELDGIW